MTHQPTGRPLLNPHAMRCLGAMMMLLTLAAGPATALDDAVLSETIHAAEIPGALATDFGSIIEGQNVVLEIAVENDTEEALQIGAVKPLCACMTQESERRIEPGATGTITLRLETVGYSGPTTEAALIEWIDSTTGLTRIEMKMDVQPIFEFEPYKLFRYKAIEGEVATDEITVRRADGKPFEIKKIEPSDTYLNAVATQIEENAYRLVATLGADAPNGILKASITLHTDLPGNPTVEIKALGLVAKTKAVPGRATAVD